MYLACIMKTVMPLIVIFQKAPRNTGFPKGGILNILKGIEVIKGGGALDCGKKKA